MSPMVLLLLAAGAALLLGGKKAPPKREDQPGGGYDDAGRDYVMPDWPGSSAPRPPQDSSASDGSWTPESAAPPPSNPTPAERDRLVAAVVAATREAEAGRASALAGIRDFHQAASPFGGGAPKTAALPPPPIARRVQEQTVPASHSLRPQLSAAQLAEQLYEQEIRPLVPFNPSWGIMPEELRSALTDAVGAIVQAGEVVSMAHPLINGVLRTFGLV